MGHKNAVFDLSGMVREVRARQCRFMIDTEIERLQKVFLLKTASEYLLAEAGDLATITAFL